MKTLSTLARAALETAGNAALSYGVGLLAASLLCPFAGPVAAIFVGTVLGTVLFVVLL